MDQPLILLVLVVLIPVAALNLFLTLRLAAIVRPDLWSPPTTVPIGRPVPAFEGRLRSGGAPLASADLAGQASVLAFLSPGCPKCAETAADLAVILPAMRSAGVALWIVPADSVHDITPLLAGTALIDHVLELEPAARRRLNPQRAAPFYLFLDETLVVQASNYVGDDDWLSFLAQMREAAEADAAQ